MLEPVTASPDVVDIDPRVEQGQVRTGSFRTHYYAAGSADSPRSAVLLHDGAWGGDGYVSWSKVMLELAREYRVYAPDLLGFGRSDKAVFLDRSPYAPRVEQIGLFCQAVGVDRPAHFVGTSFGGSVVLRAATGSDWPAASMTTIAGTGGPWRTQKGIDLLGELRPGVEYLHEVVAMLTNGEAGHDDNVARRRANTLIEGHYGAMVAPRLKHPEASPGRVADGFPGTVAGAPCPVWLIEMGADQVIESGWSAHVQAAAPGVRVLRLDGPHSPNLTDPVGLAGRLGSIFADAEAVSAR